ncbi:hypothetical protein [Paraburkholderia oxyphila]|uniref:hypothetical protein n=1 Tax=Paraburkholderia oxyphila TaxID=614212 RepID=UPI0012ED6B7C|nr:hypothetical protein [Paraburkholderia oxyphila]
MKLNFRRPEGNLHPETGRVLAAPASSEDSVGGWKTLVCMAPASGIEEREAIWPLVAST